MIPVVTGGEMREIDAAAPEPVETLIDRAGAAVATEALRMLGGSYGRRVVVVAGKGNNGADGRAAAARLRRRGVRVAIVEPGAVAGSRLPDADLVIDAAFGTGFRGTYDPPDPGAARVLGVDVPSGPRSRADVTVTFAALKPSLLLGDGPARGGHVRVADIGLDVSSARMHLVEDDDVAARLPRRDRDAHKWQTAVYVVAGSPGMLGAAHLVSTAAMHSGAGYVRLGVPGADLGAAPVGEVVSLPLPAEGWHKAVLPELDRVRSLVIGPGLGRSDVTRQEVRDLVTAAPVPVVIDADGLNALGTADEAAIVLGKRSAPTVLTPHEGEFARLAGNDVSDDRIEDVRGLARETGAVVLLKGATTVVSDTAGRVLLAMAGGPALATAGTGDVLSGVVGAFLACGLPPLEAAALAAHAHGRAASLGHAWGLVASDLPELLSTWLSSVVAGRTS